MRPDRRPRSTAMYTALAYVALGSAALWSTVAGCQYSEHPDSVMYGNDAVRVPIQSVGEPAQNECAATAQAYGLTIASIGVPLAAPPCKRSSSQPSPLWVCSLHSCVGTMVPLPPAAMCA